MLTRPLAAAIAAACCAIAGCAQPRPQPSAPTAIPATGDTMRILVFNIHAGKDAGGQPNLLEVAALVRSTGADLALVQEVDRRTKRSGNIDQVSELGMNTGLAVVFGRSLDYDGGHYGIAALARGFLANYTEHLPVKPPQARAGGSYEPRVALVTVARTPIGNLTAINTHLDASREDVYRLQEVEHVLWLARRSRPANRPLVAGGDFNAEPGSAVHQRVLAGGLRDAWLECGQGDGFTYPAAAPVKRIDYLFLAEPLTCTDARVIETRISDHRPLLVTVKARDKATP